MKELVITIRDGKPTFIYDDELLGLMEKGHATVTRASHVEPAPGGGWIADMGPSGGPVLTGFRTRAEALNAERTWLQKERGL